MNKTCSTPAQNTDSFSFSFMNLFYFEINFRPTEHIFKENSTEYIQSKLITNKESINSKCHIGLQTIYREESTQTDPFSPTYTISNGEHPEVFALTDFTYGRTFLLLKLNNVKYYSSVGKGLPATSIEISFIERLRARREWEQDNKIDMTRTRIVIEREIREWQLREKEIQM